MPVNDIATIPTIVPELLTSSQLIPLSARVTASAGSATTYVRLFNNITAQSFYVQSFTTGTTAAVTNTATVDLLIFATGTAPSGTALHTVGTQLSISTANDIEGATMTLSATQANRVLAPGESLWVKVVESTFTGALDINAVIRPV